jgi:hypothetical protein
MNIGEILIWESTNALLLIPIVIGLVVLIRWIRGKPVFTEKDWLFLFGHRREKGLAHPFHAHMRRCAQTHYCVGIFRTDLVINCLNDSLNNDLLFGTSLASMLGISKL